MIGVVAEPAEHEAVHEFFELFKTHWELAVPAKRYRAILSTRGCTDGYEADVYLAYGAAEQPWDREAGVELLTGPVEISWREARFPIYTKLAVFDQTADGVSLTWNEKRLDWCRRSREQVVYRVGYDLFREISHLLTTGQPVDWALTPTLELHIEVLRNLLLDAGIAFAEIPPRPLDHDFVCCLTHDVDFYGIRRHRFDRTLGGFVARASAGTVVDLVRGRRRPGEALRNWMALLSLPLVFLGRVRDFWRPFEDYARVEMGLPSTFFLVPFKGRPGMAPDGTSNPARAVVYQAGDIAEDVQMAVARGSEIAVHGIDAWRDATCGRAEMAELTAAAGGRPTGVRIHWLYFSNRSAQQLETAGFEYDSTCGYNETVGYRAGTSQVFRLPGTARLMELPLTVMDTALLYRGRMNLSIEIALRVCRSIMANASRLGGTLVINWHDRSLAPERLWGRCYQQLLGEVRERYRPWFATAAEAVAWFRWRRSFRFASEAADRVTIEAPATRPAGPPAVVYVYRPRRGSFPAVEQLRCDGASRLSVSL